MDAAGSRSQLPSLVAAGAITVILLFFALGLGMGAVFFAAGSLNLLARPGPWMVWVRYGFGMLLFGGALFTETIFSWPGMGRLYIQGVTDRDYFLLMGILLVGSLLVVVMNIVADVLYAIADPRIRY